MTAALAERRAFEDLDMAELAAASGPPPADRPGTGQPDPAAVAAYLADNPAAVARFGDLARQVLDRFASVWCGGLGTAAVMAQADHLRRSLAGERPNPVEVLLAERAALCWVAVHLYELTYNATNRTRLSFAAHGWHERRIDSAHRRLLAALKALATVCRLKFPNVVAVVQVTPAGRRGRPLPSPTRLPTPPHPIHRNPAAEHSTRLGPVASPAGADPEAL